MTHIFNYISHFKGELELPGDKSISHRSLIFAAMSKGESLIKNLSPGEDVKSTVKCLQDMGVNISINNNLAVVNGRGFKGFLKPPQALYAGNSGTTARLLSGVLAAQNFKSVLTGDDSLSGRPMKRIIEPLKEMGADIYSETGTLPIVIKPVDNLNPVEYRLLLPSAQVKSALILAALHLERESKIIEFIPSRDHTERMLELNKKHTEEKNIIYVSKKDYPVPREYFVSSDISTAAFFIVAALITKDSYLVVKNVSLNPSRTGLLTILKKMGASIEESNIRSFANEPFGDLVIKYSTLSNIEIPIDLIPNIIDEIPVLTVAGIFADGDFLISGAGELRYKESDRISAICTNLKNNGFFVEEYVDGFFVRKTRISHKLKLDSFGDHRIAMASGVLSMLNEKGGEVEGFECVNISNPTFLDQVKSLT